MWFWQRQIVVVLALHTNHPYSSEMFMFTDFIGSSSSSSGSKRIVCITSIAFCWYQITSYRNLITKLRVITVLYMQIDADMFCYTQAINTHSICTSFNIYKWTQAIHHTRSLCAKPCLCARNISKCMHEIVERFFRLMKYKNRLNYELKPKKQSERDKSEKRSRIYQQSDPCCVF